MTRRQKKNYYAVASGTVTGIFTDWARACAYSSGVPGNLQHGFKTLEEAKDWMLNNGCTEYFVDDTPPVDRITIGDRYYAVGNGRTNGVYGSYVRGALPRVHEYPNACHQAFSDEKQAIKHVKQHEEALMISQHIQALMKIDID